MSEQQFGWNYFENEVVIGDKRDKKRMIVVVFSNFMCIPYNKKSFDEIVDLLNEQQATIIGLQEIIIELKDDKNQLHKGISKLRQEVAELKTRNAVLSSKLNQIPKSIKEVWLDE